MHCFSSLESIYYSSDTLQEIFFNSWTFIFTKNILPVFEFTTLAGFNQDYMALVKNLALNPNWLSSVLYFSDFSYSLSLKSLKVTKRDCFLWYFFTWNKMMGVFWVHLSLLKVKRKGEKCFSVQIHPKNFALGYHKTTLPCMGAMNKELRVEKIHIVLHFVRLWA